MDPMFQAALAVLPAPYAAYVAALLSIVSAMCLVASSVDASFPQPAAGSRWVPVRHVIAWLAISKGFARNAVPAGAVPATVQQKVDEVQAAASSVANAVGELAQKVAGAPEAVKLVETPVVRAVGLLLALTAGLALSACTAAQVNRVVVDGQLVCAVGPTVVAMAYPSGAAVLAKGAPKAYVDAVCGVIGGVAVSPPGAAVPTVTVVPPVVVIPLRSAP
jgi:hypothetical protein